MRTPAILFLLILCAACGGHAPVTGNGGAPSSTSSSNASGATSTASTSGAGGASSVASSTAGASSSSSGSVTSSGAGGSAPGTGGAGTGGSSPLPPPVACSSPADCAPSVNPCATATCDAGACSLLYTAAGTALPMAQQTPGTCQKAECDGKGGVASVVDDGNSPKNKPCIFGTCKNGVPGTEPFNIGEPCDGTTGTCDAAGSCHVCATDADCPALDGVYCCGGQCAPGAPFYCGGCGVQCQGADACCADACADTTTDPANCGGCGLTCGAGSWCISSACTTPAAGNACADAADMVKAAQGFSGMDGSCANTCDPFVNPSVTPWECMSCYESGGLTPACATCRASLIACCDGWPCTQVCDAAFYACAGVDP